MKTSIETLTHAELHEFVGDCLTDIQAREVTPSLHTGFDMYQRKGQLLAPSMMANLLVYRQSFVGQSRWGRSFWRNSIFARMVIDPVPSEMDGISIANLEKPERSLRIHAYPENHPAGVRVFEGDVIGAILEDRQRFHFRAPTEADLTLLNQVIASAITGAD